MKKIKYNDNTECPFKVKCKDINKTWEYKDAIVLLNGAFCGNGTHMCKYYEYNDKDRQIIYCLHPDFFMGYEPKIEQKYNYNTECLFNGKEKYVGYNWCYKWHSEDYEKEYEYVDKNVSMMGMQELHPCNHDFKEACKEWLNMNYTLDSFISLKDLITVAKKYNGIDWLISKNIIRKVEEEITYKVGDKFIFANKYIYDHSKFMITNFIMNNSIYAGLTRIERDSKGVIGSMWHYPTIIKNRIKITLNEFIEMCGPHGKEYFKKINND